MPGDLVHQVQLLIGDLNCIFNPLSLGDISQDPVNPDRFSRKVEPEKTFLLTPVHITPFIQDPEPENELGTFFQFRGHLALQLPDIRRMDENMQRFPYHFLFKVPIFVDLRRGIGYNPVHIRRKEDVRCILRECPVFFLALLECIFDQFLLGDIRDRANPPVKPALIINEWDSLAEQPVQSSVRVDVPGLKPDRSSFPDGFSNILSTRSRSACGRKSAQYVPRIVSNGMPVILVKVSLINMTCPEESSRNTPTGDACRIPVSSSVFSVRATSSFTRSVISRTMPRNPVIMPSRWMGPVYTMAHICVPSSLFR